MATNEGVDKAETCDKDKRHGARIAQCDEIQENMNMTVHAACEEEKIGRRRHKKGARFYDSCSASFCLV